MLGKPISLVYKLHWRLHRADIMSTAVAVFSLVCLVCLMRDISDAQLISPYFLAVAEPIDCKCVTYAFLSSLAQSLI